MFEILFLTVGFLVVAVLIALTYWAVATKQYDDNPLDEIQNLANRAAELADTALIYQRMGMEEEAVAALDESERLNNKVWEVINAHNHLV